MAKKHMAVMGIKGLPSKGGAERVAEAIIKRALNEGFTVTVYSKKSYYEVFPHSDSLRNIIIKDFKGKHINAFLYGLFSALHALLFGKYDVIHLHCADYGYLVPLLKLRFKIVGTAHGAEYNRDKWGKIAKLTFKLFEAPFVKYVDICTCMSKTLAEYYNSKYTLNKEVLYIPNGIDFDDNYKVRDFPCKTNPALPWGNYILFCANRIIKSKGCEILLQAYKKMDRRITVVVIGHRNGDPSYKKYLDEIADENIVFIDFISCKEELFKIISGCKCFVFPSSYEAMSMMLLEVASLKKGIVCSDIPENIEAIGENALYFQTNDVDDLAKKLDYALANESEMNKIGENAYLWIKEYRNWDNITKKYIELYNLIVDRIICE